MQVRIAHRAGDHMLHILPQCLFMTMLRIVGTARNVVPLVDGDPSAYSDCDAFVCFRAHPDSGLFKVICVQPESVLTEPFLMGPPFFSIPGQVDLLCSSVKNATLATDPLLHVAHERETHHSVVSEAARRNPWLAAPIPHIASVTMRISSKRGSNKSCSPRF